MLLKINSELYLLCRLWSSGLWRCVFWLAGIDVSEIHAAFDFVYISSMFLWSAGIHIQDYTVSNPRIPESEQPLPWKPFIYYVLFYLIIIFPLICFWGLVWQSLEPGRDHILPNPPQITLRLNITNICESSKQCYGGSRTDRLSLWYPAGNRSIKLVEG